MVPDISESPGASQTHPILSVLEKWKVTPIVIGMTFEILQATPVVGKELRLQLKSLVDAQHSISVVIITLMIFA